jgi:hypothetical protein
MSGGIMRRKLMAAGAAAAVVLVGGWLLSSDSRPPVSPHAAAVGGQAGQSTPTGEASVQPTQAARPVAGEVVSGPELVRQMYETTDNYADFIRRALGERRPGAQFYATLAWERCEFVRTAPVAALTSQKARDVFGTIAHKCRDVALHYPDRKTFLLLAADARAGADPILGADAVAVAANTLVWGAAGATVRASQLQSAIDSADARMIALLGRASGQPLTPRFGGQALDPAAAVAYRRAWDVVQCELGACDPLLLALSCTPDGAACPTTAIEAYRAALTPAEAAAVEAFASDILAALRGGNVAAFTK